MLLLLIRPIKRIFGFIVQQDQIEETTEQAQQIASEDQLQEPSPEMHQKPPNDGTSASGDNSKTVNPVDEDGRHEGLPRAISGTATPKHPGGHRASGDRSQSRPIRARLESLENNHHQLTDKHESLERKYRDLSEVNTTTVTDLRKTHAAYKNQQEEIKNLKERLRNTSALLDVRNQELKVAKTFLSKEDTFSTSDVVQSVRDLNSEIMQTAAHLVENLPLKCARVPPPGLPQGYGDEVDVGSLELALQALLAAHACWITNTWGFSQTSGWCDQLYSKVCEMEDHTVASNWRVLTRRTLSDMDSSRGDLPHQIVNEMIGQLAGLLSTRGVGEFVDNTNNIRQHAADKLGSLYAAARKLNKMIGENIVSDDLTVTAINGGCLFDGEYMEDAYARGGVKPARRTVICTTDLGLCESRGAKGAKILLKPKVAVRNL